jgi:predicted phosphodiesterase
MFSLFPILALLATPHVKPYLKTDHLLLNKVKESANGVVWIDVENVRGKSGFGLSHDELLRKTSQWTEYHELGGKVILVVDHGSSKCGYYLDDKDLAIVFAGPSEKADDVVANGVSLFGESIVITADRELKSRCQRFSTGGMHIMDPAKYIDDMEMASTKSDEAGDPEVDEDTPLSLGKQITLGKLDDEIRLRGQLLDAEIQLGKKKKATNKKRKKLQSRIERLREQLALRGPSLMDRLTSIDSSLVEKGMSFEPDEQDLLLSRWQELQHRSIRREQTGDRVVYAERLRRQVLKSETVRTEFENCDLSSAKSFVQYINGLEDQASTMDVTDDPNSPSHNIHVDCTSISPPAFSTYELLSQANDSNLKTLKMVVVSDTHGFESQLVGSNDETEVLPDGDILLHLGDFALEGSYESEDKGLKQFDLWLARQPHKYKIVVRGNHDPWTYDFPASRAWYINEPASATIGGLKMAIVPYGSARKITASGKVPTECDIFVSHVPPHKTLDRTLNNKNAGSAFLSRMVRSMKNNAPRLWLCGHIHEGRGMKKHKFGNVETTVVNAANANSGKATHLTHGPMVLQMETETKEVVVVGLEDKAIDHMQSTAEFFGKSDGKRNELLLAVDLGLKSGLSLFNCHGNLVRYEQFVFKRGSLTAEFTELIKQWEADVPNDENFLMDESIGENPWKVTHIAVEGEDVDILKAWASAAPDLSITRISPQEWRSEMLLSKEKLSGADSKAAARLIARQVVADYGTMGQHEGKFKTDAAEAVVMGLYTCRKLGWISREPAVRRYTNGNVVVPK